MYAKTKNDDFKSKYLKYKKKYLDLKFETLISSGGSKVMGGCPPLIICMDGNTIPYFEIAKNENYKNIQNGTTMAMELNNGIRGLKTTITKPTKPGQETTFDKMINTELNKETKLGDNYENIFVSVNKTRGFGTNQGSKIGDEEYHLIDYQLFKGDNLELLDPAKLPNMKKFDDIKNTGKYNDNFNLIPNKIDKSSLTSFGLMGSSSTSRSVINFESLLEMSGDDKYGYAFSDHLPVVSKMKLKNTDNTDNTIFLLCQFNVLANGLCLDGFKLPMTEDDKKKAGLVEIFGGAIATNIAINEIINLTSDNVLKLVKELNLENLEKEKTFEEIIIFTLRKGKKFLHDDWEQFKIYLIDEEKKIELIKKRIGEIRKFTKFNFESFNFSNQEKLMDDFQSIIDYINEENISKLFEDILEKVNELKNYISSNRSDAPIKDKQNGDIDNGIIELRRILDSMHLDYLKKLREEFRKSRIDAYLNNKKKPNIDKNYPCLDKNRKYLDLIDKGVVKINKESLSEITKAFYKQIFDILFYAIDKDGELKKEIIREQKSKQEYQNEMPKLIKYRVGLFKDLFKVKPETNFIACIQEDDYWPFIFSENYEQNHTSLKIKDNGLYGEIKIGNETVSFARMTKKIKINNFENSEGEDTFEKKLERFDVLEEPANNVKNGFGTIKNIDNILKDYIENEAMFKFFPSPVKTKTQYNKHAYHGDGVTIYFKGFNIVPDKTKFGISDNKDPYIILRLKDQNENEFDIISTHLESGRGEGKEELRKKGIKSIIKEYQCKSAKRRNAVLKLD
tara:strand:+ start:899 stop:3274 length:2376 start_codon:yes stop_codon:yes gene_type:complete